MIRVWIGDKHWLTWTKLSLRRSLESPISELSLTLLERGYTGEVLGLYPYQDIVLKDDYDNIVFTGYIEKLGMSIEPNRWEIKIDAISKAGILRKQTWLGKQKETSIRELCDNLSSRYGLKFDIRMDFSKPLDTSKHDNLWEMLDRYIRDEGCLCWEKPNGTIMIGLPEYIQGEDFIFGQSKIISWELSIDCSERYTHYKVLGYGKQEDIVTGEAEDIGWTDKVMTKVIESESQIDRNIANKRAEWEATIRASRSARVQLQLKGEIDEKINTIYDIGITHSVIMPHVGILGKYITTEISIDISSVEKITNLSLVGAKAYLLQPKQVRSIPRKKPVKKLGQQGDNLTGSEIFTGQRLEYKAGIPNISKQWDMEE